MGMMEAKTLGVIQRRFAEKSAVVQREFSQSESFRDLCRDYRACVTALAGWQEADSEQGRQRSAEYAELLAELNDEIEARLRASEDEGNETDGP